MKIRIEISTLATPHQSGVSSYTRLLTEALDSTGSLETHGHYFNFLNRQPSPRLHSKKLKEEENALVPLRIYAKLQSYGVAPPFDILLPRVDLTIFPNFATWPTVKSGHSATVVHDLTYLYYPELVESKNLQHLRRVVPRSIRTADFIITVSESVKKEIVKEFGINPDRCVVTPVPPEESFRAVCDDDKLMSVRSRYNIGPKKFILFLGNFEPRKNLKTLIEAYRLLPQHIKDDYRLVLAGGKGWRSEETQAALDAALGDGEDVVHIGYVAADDRAALYQSASLFVMPSLYEGFGIPILEAMLSKCPVVAADIPVLKETGGDAALYADPKSADGFSKAIQQAIESYPYSHQTMVKNVRRFSWEKNVATILEITSKLK